MLNFNPDGKKVIASIDGGGMRGVIVLGMLAELEAMTGKPAYDLFDMIAGTSTGAIIAAALAVGMTAQETLDKIYKERLPKAFPPRDLFFWLRYLFGGLRHLYPVEPFIETTLPFVQGRKVGDIEKPILLFTTKDMRTGTTLYVVNKGPGRALFADWPLSGAVGSSSAAPIFFPPVAGNLVDGGVGVYGNPSLAAAVEAMEYIGAEHGFVDGRVMLLSFGTGHIPNIVKESGASSFSIFQWINYLLVEGVVDSAMQQVFVTGAIYKDRLDYRRYNPLLTPVSVMEKLQVEIPKGLDPSVLGLDSTAPAEIDLMERIGRAYARAIDWTKPGQMPWDTAGGHTKPRVERFPVDWSGTGFI